jgi:hypothetical protein
LELAQLRQNYLLQLDRMGYLNGRYEVKMDALLQDIQCFYSRGFLEKLGCRGQHWIVRMLRNSMSVQQPIRHLLLVNYIGISLEDLFAPKPLPWLNNLIPVAHPNIECANHLCPQHGKTTSGFVDEARSSVLGGMIENYCCEACGQVQARCCVGQERTWVRDYGHLWRARLAELWADTNLGLRDLAMVLRVSCDTARKHALKAGLPLMRLGRRPLSVRSYPHLLVSKAEKRRQKLESLRQRWLEERSHHSDLGTRNLRQRIPAVYATLYRYDREWLKAHRPARKARDLSVDWDERDRAFCRKLELAACHLRSATPGRLARAAGVKGWISDRLSRLPRARQTLRRLTRGCRVSRCGVEGLATACRN